MKNSGGTFLIVIAIIGLVLGGIILAGPTNNNTTNTNGQTSTSPQVSEDASLINRSGAPRIGPENAKVKVVIFSDYLCPYCKEFHSSTANKILNDYPNDVSVTIRTLLIHPQAEILQKAAEAAYKQDKFKEMADELFGLSTNNPTEDDVIKLAQKIALNTDQFKADLNSPEVQANVDKDNSDGQTLNLPGTPSVFVNNKYIENPGEVENAVKEALGK